VQQPIPLSGAGSAPPDDRRSGRRGSRWKLAVAAVIALAVIAAFAYRWRTAGFQWHEFTATFVDVNWVWLGLTVPVVLLTYIGRTLRWAVMMRPLKSHPSFWGILNATCIGFTAIVFFGRAGELVRPYLIATRERVPFTSQLGAWLLERILDLLMVIILFGAALAQISHSGVALGPRMKWVVEAGGAIILLTGVGCMSLILLFRYMSQSMLERLTGALAFLPDASRKKVDQLVKAFVEGMGSTRSGGFVWRLLLYSLLEWIIITGCFVSLFRAFPATQHFSLTDVIVFVGVVSIGSAIQIPGVGGGMQVASILVFTEFFRLSLEVATGIALVLWAVSFLVVVPIGLLLAFREGLNLRKLARLSETDSTPEAGLP
jgi:glycosyltransferase 2 family protein